MGTISTGAGSIACSITNECSPGERPRVGQDRDVKAKSRRIAREWTICEGSIAQRYARNYDFPPEFVQSECYFKSIFHLWLRIEPTEEEQQAFLTTAREVFLSLQ